MREYRPPPNLKTYGSCQCKGPGTLYEIENLELPLVVCAQCGFVGCKEDKDVDNYKSSYISKTDNCEERIDTLEQLISDGYNWLGVAAPRTQTSTKAYRDLVKRFAAVRQRVKSK